MFSRLKSIAIPSWTLLVFMYLQGKKDNFLFSAQAVRWDVVLKLGASLLQMAYAEFLTF
jgi:hypothetical protein